MPNRLKFRAKATQDYGTNTDGIQKGDWVYGYYYFCRNRMSGIIVTDLGAESGGVGSGIVQAEVEVDEKTLGQSTGKNDKDGEEVFEGNMVIYKQADGGILPPSKEKLCKVIFEKDSYILIDAEAVKNGKCGRYYLISSHVKVVKDTN
jgi:uncharacterized phage protein (TIGR01671 family)